MAEYTYNLRPLNPRDPLANPDMTLEEDIPSNHFHLPPLGFTTHNLDHSARLASISLRRVILYVDEALPIIFLQKHMRCSRDWNEKLPKMDGPRSQRAYLNLYFGKKP